MEFDFASLRQVIFPFGCLVFLLYPGGVSKELDNLLRIHPDLNLTHILQT